MSEAYHLPDSSDSSMPMFKAEYVRTYLKQLLDDLEFRGSSGFAVSRHSSVCAVVLSVEQYRRLLVSHTQQT